MSLPALRTEQLTEANEQGDDPAAIANASTDRDRMTERAESMPSLAADTQVVLMAPTVIEGQEIPAPASTLTTTHEAKTTIADISWPQSQRTDRSVAVDPLLTEFALVDEVSAEAANEPSEQLQPRQETTRRSGESRFDLPLTQTVDASSVVFDLPTTDSSNHDSIASVSLNIAEAMPIGNLVDTSQPEISPLLAAAPLHLDLILPTRAVVSPEIYQQRAPEQRQELVQRMGGSQETERAVAMALDWLARHQSPDGRWAGARFDDRCRYLLLHRSILI